MPRQKSKGKIVLPCKIISVEGDLLTVCAPFDAPSRMARKNVRINISELLPQERVYLQPGLTFSFWATGDSTIGYIEMPQFGTRIRFHNREVEPLAEVRRRAQLYEDEE